MTTSNQSIANHITWRTLEHTKNPAATVLLGVGLTHPWADVRNRSLRALIARNDDPANMLVLTHWNVYDERDFALLRQYAPQFAPAIRTLLSRGSLAVKGMMLAAISKLDICESVDVLLELALSKKHPLHEQAAQCLLSLCDAWGTASRLGETRGASHRPSLVNMLYNELLRYPKNELIMRAWLSVVHWEDGQQRSLLSDAGNPAYSTMLKLFSETNDPVALQLLAGYLWRSTTPASIQSIICEQRSPGLIVEMAKLIGEDQLEAVLHRLRTSTPLSCSSDFDPENLPLEKAVMRRLLLIMAASREDIRWALSKCTALAKGNSSESRRLATEVLHWTRPLSLERLIAIMQDDATQNNGQQAYRDIHEVLSWLKSASVPLRQAASQFFAEFTVEYLIKQINYWPARMCRVMAEVVSTVDKNKIATLQAFLESPAPKKRIAALQAVEYLNCAHEVSDMVLSMLHDPRIEVRVRAIDTLASSHEERLLKLIPELLTDANTDVVDAASRASKLFERSQAAQSR